MYVVDTMNFSKLLAPCACGIALILLLVYLEQSTGNGTDNLYQKEFVTKKPKIDDKLASKQITTTTICSQQQRKTYLQQMCANYRGLIRKKIQRLNIDNENKVLYCSVSKASCTTWKVLWENYKMNRTNNFDLPKEVHGSSMKQAHISRKLVANWKRHFPHLLNYTKFVVIRHPLDRVLSGYYNAIRTSVDKSKGEYGPSIKDFRRAFSLTVNESITLSQFVNAITDPHVGRGGVYSNRHWMPYTQTCDFCNVDYDHIIRTETMSHYPYTDAAPMLKLFGYESDMLHKMSFNSRKKETKLQSSIRHKYLKEFKDVPKELMDKLLQRYKYDMELFGYKFDTETLTTSCEITTGDSTCC